MLFPVFFMTLTANNIEHLFLGALTFYVLVECLLTVLHTRAAERASSAVPPRFEGKLSAAAHKKAADYTTECAQAQLLLAILGAGFALLMTFGNGISLLAAFAESLTANTVRAQWVLLVLMLFIMAVVDFPFEWVSRFRIAERFGYMRQKRLEWLAKNAKETFTGWLLSMPLAALLLIGLELTGGNWWRTALVLWGAYLVWRWMIAPSRGVFWKRRARELRDPQLEALIGDYLASKGLRLEGISLMTRPASWGHSHIVLSGWGRKRRLIVFAHAAARLTREELLALVAHDTGHIRHAHRVLRVALYFAAGALVTYFAGWGSENAAFFEGFGLSAALITDHPGTNAGYVIACALVAFPILFFPLQPLVNLFVRMMQYDADRYAMKTVGAGPMIRALVKLHRDYATTLTPSFLYSIYHYPRPHAGMRVAALVRAVEKRGTDEEKPADYCGFNRFEPQRYGSVTEIVLPKNPMAMSIHAALFGEEPPRTPALAGESRDG